VGPHATAGEKCEEGGAAETKCAELMAAPIPCPPAPLEEVEKIRSEVEPGKKGEGGGGEGALRLRLFVIILLWFRLTVNVINFP